MDRYTLIRWAALLLAVAGGAWYVAELRAYRVPPLMLAATGLAVGWVLREAVFVLAARFGPRPGGPRPDGARR